LTISILYQWFPQVNRRTAYELIRIWLYRSQPQPSLSGIAAPAAVPLAQHFFI
jgi:hypothetical protein